MKLIDKFFVKSNRSAPKHGHHFQVFEVNGRLNLLTNRGYGYTCWTPKEIRSARRVVQYIKEGRVRYTWENK